MKTFIVVEFKTGRLLWENKSREIKLNVERFEGLTKSHIKEFKIKCVKSNCAALNENTANEITIDGVDPVISPRSSIP